MNTLKQFLGTVLLLSILPMMMNAQFVGPAPLVVPGDNYAFAYSTDGAASGLTSFGLYFNETGTAPGYEFRGSGSAKLVNIQSIAAGNREPGDITFGATGSLIVNPNRYAFRFSLTNSYGLFFNAAGFAYEFRTADASPVFSIGANSGTLTSRGNIAATDAEAFYPINLQAYGRGLYHYYQPVDTIERVALGTWLGQFQSKLGGWYGTFSNHPLYFFIDDGGPAMTIDTLERVGIGTFTPGGLFELSLDEGRKPSTTTWTITSDERLKNITGQYEKGLDEILQLKTISYQYKNVGERTFAPEVLSTKNVGFNAQEVQKIFPEAVGTDDDGYLNFNMHAILVAQVNATQELNQKLEDENNELRNEIREIKDMLKGFDLSLNECCANHQKGSIDQIESENASLGQNVPNPFTNSTTIEYYLPQSTGQSTIQIFNLKGQLIKTYQLETGYGQVEFSNSELAAGSYIYSLIIDDRVIATKKMILK